MNLHQGLAVVPIGTLPFDMTSLHMCHVSCVQGLLAVWPHHDKVFRVCYFFASYGWILLFCLVANVYQLLHSLIFSWLLGLLPCFFSYNLRKTSTVWRKCHQNII